LELAGQDAKAFAVQRDADERERALRSLGVQEGGSIPPQLRAQIRQLEEDQKRRATRSLRDGIDRILVDLMSLHRDVLLHQLGADLPQVNEAIAPRIAEAAGAGSAAASLAVLDAVGVARRRINGNVAPALALEAMLVSITRTRPAGGA
ncbi:DNA polymerase III subunit delta', partial [Clavibacter nebraskensis]